MTTDSQPDVVSVTDPNGVTWYAWRKDGQRPVIDEEAFARNSHTATAGRAALPADFADRFGPQEPPR